MSVVLACDLGGTSFRACLVDDAGTIRASAVVPSPQALRRDGWSEIAPQLWWSNLVEATAELALQAPDLFGSVCAISICGLTRSQVLLDCAGHVLRDAMTWNDTRATNVASELARHFEHAHETQHPEVRHLNAFHPLARLAWLKTNEPDLFRQIRHVLDPKDYLNFRLTGKPASDSISLARLLAACDAEQEHNLLAECGIQTGIVPPILAPHDKVGVVLSGLPKPFDRLGGVPVVCCSNDTWAAVAGLGAMRHGYAYNISGTTEVLGVLGDSPALAEGLLTVDWGGLFQLGGPSLNGADTVSWLLSLLGDTRGDMAGAIASLLAVPREAQPVLFLPFLQGERVPYWDPSLRGAFLGLGRQHGAADLVWAVMEGIAFLNREVLERAEAALGWQASPIRFGGGGAANPVWCQIKADICGRPVETCAATEPGVLGAAAVAWTGLGRFSCLAQAQERMVEVGTRFMPNPHRAADYAQMFGLFQAGIKALAPVSRALAGLAIMPAVPARTLTGN